MRTKQTSKRNILIAMAIVGAGLLSAVPAFATSIGGYAGKTLPTGAANQACMNELNGGVVSRCGNQTNYQIPLAVNQGSHTVTFTTYNPGGGTFWCRLLAVDNFGNTTADSGQYFVNLHDDLHSFTVTTQPQGSLYLNCDVNPNGQIFNVNYNE